jgi:acetylornithine deacetylase
MNHTARPTATTREMLTALIGFNTISHHPNLELIDYVYEYLQRLGVQSRLDFNADRSKANLYAVVGPPDRPGIALSGHTDVVPVAGQDWTRDPWRADEQGDRIYGRGAADMKGFIAVALAAVPAMLEAPLQRPLHLCWSYDEEVGCLGVRSLLEFLARQDNKPAACIVGEPSGMQVINGHKGKLSVRCHVHGHACHSALAPYGVNAVEAAARVIAQLHDMAAHKREHGPFDETYDIPYSTLHAGVVHGGTTVNIVPAECWFDFEVRNLPREEPGPIVEAVKRYAHEHIEPQMQAVAADTGFHWEELARFPGLETRADEDIVEMATSLAQSPRLRKVAFGTEAGGYDRIGIRTVVCGPGHIEQAHKPDEFIELSQLASCEDFIARLIRELC